MTSQHFGADEGWGDEWGDWGENNSKNNNNIKPQISQNQPVQMSQQQNYSIPQQQPTSVAPIYSPFAYQQPQQQPPLLTHHQPLQQQPPPPLSTHHQQQFNNSSFFSNSTYDNVNNNQHNQANTNVAFSNQTLTSPSQVQQVRGMNKTQATPLLAANTGHQEEVKRLPIQQYQSPINYPGAPQTPFMPSPSTSPMQLPPPPQTENITDDLYTSSQQKNLPAPPPIQTYETNFNRQTPDQVTQTYHSGNWQKPPISSVSVGSEHFNMNQTFQTNINQQQHQQNVSPPNQIVGTSYRPPNEAVFNTPPSLNDFPQQSFRGHQEPPTTSSTAFTQSSSQFFDPSGQQMQHEISGQPFVPPPSSSSSNVVQNKPEQQVNFSPMTGTNVETFYPENRERLDDVAPPASVSSTATSFTDRHNYLVTGQLSQDRVVVSSHYQFQENVNLPPPGLSRMVVGQPESNHEQIPTSDIPPPGLNRMVTGTEGASHNYINYQRQADGEVSQVGTPIQRPQTNSPFNHQPPQPETSQHNFNTSDRNLYLVAGESDANNQRVIPGVESDGNLPPVIMNPLQNLHIQDDDDFVNVSVAVQERNLNVDGMETGQDVQPREEVIDGANDNNESFNIVQVSQVQDHGAVLKDPEPDVREEAIEGANDYNEDVGRSKNSDSKNLIGSKKSKPESSEDSELRELEANMSLSKARRSKKYTDDSIDSENDYSDIDKREKHDDSRRRHNREKMSREEYERYRKREKERKPRRNDDTDGSKYGDSKRRTDEEDDYRRNRDKYKKSSRSRNQDDVDVDEKDKKKREKYRESGSRRKDHGYDDDRRERRRRERYYDDDNYSGRRSQNTSDREYSSDRYTRRSRDHMEKDRKFDANSYYQQYAGYDPNYNYNSYYQQQQYFETLRRTNPQAYYDWYTKYYGMIQQQQAQQVQPTSTIDDIGGSLRSGYSSSNEKERSNGSRFLPGGNVSNPVRGINTSYIDNTEYPSLQGFTAAVKDLNQTYASLNYNQGYGYDNYRDKNVVTGEAQRLTPKKFQSLHGFVRLGSGMMATIDSSNADNFIIKIGNLPISDKTKRLYHHYPGPLVRGVSHKKTVIEFCEEKLKQDQLVLVSQRASYSLLWSYLILMLRQNGNYTETDISELLMKNSEDFKGMLNSSSSDDHKIIANEDNTDISESDENAGSEKNSNSVSQSHEDTTTSTVSDKVVIHKFRDYLLYGNVNDALDFATENNLWGHALFLASKVDRRQHANVMLKFANKLPYNDPLQTLYQIMSGRMPSCVTNLDDKWGDWRPHLAMIISNCTDKPDLVKRSIMALGDSLATRGDIFGSQFCYLLVEPNFCDYNEDGKMSLLGMSRQKSFKEFANDDAIIMTEVYEYARSLSDENFFIPSLQKFKYLLAGKILDYGSPLKSLLYMEHIAKCILSDPSMFQISFILKIYSLADRLKFYDPEMAKSYEDNFNNNEPIEDLKWLQDLSSLCRSYDDSLLSYQPKLQQQTPQVSSGEIYSPLSYQSAPSGIYDPMSQQQTPTHASSTYGDDQLLQFNQQQEQNQTTQMENSYQYQQHDQNFSYEYNNPPGAVDSTQNYVNQQESSSGHNNYQQQQPTMSTDYGYSWDQHQQQKPTITMGNTTSNNFDDNSQKSGTNDAAKQQSNKAEADKMKGKKPQDGTTQSGGGGWFGGIFSKLSMKPKNQMILPDDKNPTIVWDEATKKWVNKDEDATEAESFKPPPKMGDMMGNKVQQTNNIQSQAPQIPTMSQIPQMPQQYSQPLQSELNQPRIEANNVHQQPMINQQQQQSNVMSAGQDTIQPQLPGTSAPNMFKMQKGRNLKKSYVDILGNSGQTVSQPKELAPQMDMQFFNPVQQQPQGMQFYNPNDFN
ncbi:CLUMA_CG020473, isoform A [Clunio marinus]|uniref:CLUMA_CG020473, isoform A n=1 Tax=Clunio marinus TaxID=568069 RepID=A0A1J1J519_9DIPT|nr:CLUMA_CG020473, isoform A [Clunio marinus]